MQQVTIQTEIHREKPHNNSLNKLSTGKILIWKEKYTVKFELKCLKWIKILK